MINNKKIEDQLLWNRFRSGDMHAYQLIYQRYVRLLLTYGLQFTHDTELIKDAVQDTFIRIYKYRANLKETDNIQLYLLITTKNQLMRLLTQKHIQYERDEEDINISNYEDCSHEEKIIIEETEEYTRRRVNEVLKQLTPRQQEIIRYRFIDCLSLDEIGVIMDMNYQSVQNLLQRSLKKIREKIKKIYSD